MAFSFRSLVYGGFIFLVACSFQENKLPDKKASALGLNSFAGLQANIFEPKCMSCHNATARDGDVDLSTYASIMAGRGLVLPGHLSQSLVFTEVEDGSMPKDAPALKPEEVQAISDWIMAGAPEEGEFGSSPSPIVPPVTPSPVTPPPATPPRAPAYLAVQTRLFDVSCVRCHSGTKPSGRIDLTSYAKVMGNAKKVVVPGAANRSLVYTEIVNKSMPPRGTVSAEDLAILRDWINEGAKND